MRIFFVSATNTGCSKWRAEIPTKYLRRNGHTVHFFDEWQNAECPDAIVFSRQYHFDLSRLYNWAKERNLRVVYDTDDALDLVDKWNPAYEFSRRHHSQAVMMASNADVITTTTPELANHLRKLNPNVVVIPNSVDPEDWTVQPRTVTDRIRIGWLGGSSHFLDLAIAADAMSDVVKKLNVQFVVYGLTDLPSVEEMYRKRLKAQGESFRGSSLGRAIKTFLRKTQNLPYEFQPHVAASEYAATLCELRFDVGIAPLADTAFNRNKSCIKYYEYGMSGAVTVASNVLPYSAEVPVLCDNSRTAWKERLGDLAHSDRRAMWEAQYEWILSHRNIQRNVGLWEEVLGGSNSLSSGCSIPANTAPSYATV